MDKLGIFRTKSFIERKYGKSVEEDLTLKKQVRVDWTRACADLLKNYKALEVDLGAGSFSNVFLFESRSNPRMKYAVKIMFKSDFDEVILKLVNEEVGILAMLDHPNIVKYTESYEDEENLYIVMEYLEDATELQKMIDKQIKIAEKDESKKNESLFPEKLVCKMMYMLLRGLHHIHTNNIVHRDVKPENCLID